MNENGSLLELMNEHNRVSGRTTGVCVGVPVLTLPVWISESEIRSLNTWAYELGYMKSFSDIRKESDAALVSLGHHSHSKRVIDNTKRNNFSY